MPLRDDPLIHELIAANEAYYEATNRGKLAEVHGDIAPYLTPAEKKEIAGLMERRMEAELRLFQEYAR